VRGKVDSDALKSIKKAFGDKDNLEIIKDLRRKADMGELNEAAMHKLKLLELDQRRIAEARKNINSRLRKHNHAHGAVGVEDIDLDNVEFSVFNATNKPPAADKIGFDRDITYRAVIPERTVKVPKNGGGFEDVIIPSTEIDIPASMVEPHYNKSLYENMNPGASADLFNRDSFDTISEFGKKMDHQVTDFRHADAYLVDNIGEFFSDPTTLTKDRAQSFADTVIYKSEHWFDRAEATLKKAVQEGSDEMQAEAMAEMAEGMRQASKQYDNYLSQFVGKGGFDEFAALSPELISGMDIFKQVREGVLSVPQADAALEAMGLTRSAVVSMAGLEYEAFKKLSGPGIKFSTEATRMAFKNLLRELMRKSIGEVKKEEEEKDDEEDEEEKKDAGGGRTYAVTPPPTKTTGGVLGMAEPAKLAELESYYEICGEQLALREAKVEEIKSGLKGLDIIIPARDKTEELIEQLKVLHAFLQNFLAKYKFKLSKIEISAKAMNESGITVVENGAVLLREDKVTFNVDVSLPETAAGIYMRMRWQLCNASGIPLSGESMKHRYAFPTDGNTTSVDWTFNIPDDFPKSKYLLRVIQEVVDYPTIKSVAFFRFSVGEAVVLKKMIISLGPDVEKDHKKLDTEQSPHLLAYMEFADSLNTLEVEAKVELTVDKSVLQEDTTTFNREGTKPTQRFVYSVDKTMTKTGDSLKFTLKLVPHVGDPIIDDKTVVIEEKTWELELKVFDAGGVETKIIMRQDSFTAKVVMTEELEKLEIGETEWFVVTPGGKKNKSSGTNTGEAGLTKMIQTSEKWTNIGKYEIIAVVHSGEQTFEGHAFINLIEEPEVVITVFDDKGVATTEIKQGKRFNAKAELPSIAERVEIGNVQWGIRTPGASDYKYSSRSRSGKKGLNLGMKTKDDWKLGMYGLICKVKLGDLTASGVTEFELTEPDLIFAKMTRPVRTGQWTKLVYPEEDVTIDLSKPFKLEGLGKYKHKKYWKINWTEVSFRPIKDGIQRVKFDFVDSHGERTHFKTVDKAELTEMPTEIDWDDVTTRNKKDYVKFKMTLPDSFEPRFDILIRPKAGVDIGKPKKKKDLYHFEGEICLDDMDRSKGEIIFDLTDKTDAIAHGIIDIDDCECLHPPPKVKAAGKRITDPKRLQSAMQAISRIKDDDVRTAKALNLSRKWFKDFATVFNWMGSLKNCHHIDSSARRAFNGMGDMFEKVYDYSADGDISDEESDILKVIAQRALAGFTKLGPKSFKAGFMGGKSNFMFKR
jgi:hypothetical protein